MNSFCSKNCNPYKCYQTIIGSVSFVTKVAILYILLCSIANYFAAFEKLRSNRFCRQFASLVFQKSHFQCLFWNLHFAQSQQNHFEYLPCSLFTNKFAYARYAHSQIRHLHRFCFLLPSQLYFHQVFFSRLDAVIRLNLALLMSTGMPSIIIFE